MHTQRITLLLLSAMLTPSQCLLRKLSLQLPNTRVAGRFMCTAFHIILSASLILGLLAMEPMNIHLMARQTDGRPSSLRHSQSAVGALC